MSADEKDIIFEATRKSRKTGNDGRICADWVESIFRRCRDGPGLVGVVGIISRCVVDDTVHYIAFSSECWTN